MEKIESIKILDKKNVQYRLIELSERGISFEDVVKYSKKKITPKEICKTIIVRDKNGNKYAFFLKGDEKIDFSKAKSIIGKKISIVGYDDLIKTTKTEPGAICPLLLKDIPLFVDKKIFETEKINFGSGDHLHGLEINTKDLDKIIKFKIVSIAQ
ncbi:YbaK/EbsC family protein [Candidatus Pacearchaeota archaeon]|nr:YbaK/EbsC family protein [Candidatus Pacearchaeota archaeon]